MTKPYLLSSQDYDICLGQSELRPSWTAESNSTSIHFYYITIICICILPMNGGFRDFSGTTNSDYICLLQVCDQLVTGMPGRLDKQTLGGLKSIAETSVVELVCKFEQLK